jgi:hypothetical protein
MTDFIVMVRDTSYMFVTGPEVVRAVTNEDVTAEALGGAQTHSRVSGVCHGAFDNEIDAMAGVRNLVSFLPQSSREKAPQRLSLDRRDRPNLKCLDTVVPDDPNQPYDMRAIVERIIDDGELVEIQPEYARNIITGFARMEGRTVGVVANQPRELAGCLHPLTLRFAQAGSERLEAVFVRAHDQTSVGEMRRTLAVLAAGQVGYVVMEGVLFLADEPARRASASQPGLPQQQRTHVGPGRPRGACCCAAHHRRRYCRSGSCRQRWRAGGGGAHHRRAATVARTPRHSGRWARPP